MKQYIKKVFLYAVFFLTAFCLMFGFLILSAKVKKESIQDNFEKSAEFLCREKVFFYVENEIEPSCIDWYADSILLNIAYNFEPDNVLKSVMWSSYYHDRTKEENKNLYSTVNEGLKKNKQYLRYWHGSAGIIRILHIFTDINTIYIIHGIILLILTGILFVLLIHLKCIFEAIAIVLSMIAVSIWYVPFSLEYTWVFICMFTCSIISIVLVRKKKDGYLGIMFMISGMVTIFLDFLTTETLTFTIPMLLVLVLKKHGYGDDKCIKGIKNGIAYTGKMLISWGIGYIGMWISKWMAASLILGENVMPYVTEHIEERLAGEIGSISLAEYLWMAFTRNINSLFPLDYGTGGFIIAGIILLGAAYFCFVYKKNKIEWKYIILFLVIGVIPIVRFLVMRNHSVLHYFFVHRALAGSVFAVLLSAGCIIDFEKMKKTRRRKK